MSAVRSYRYLIVGGGMTADAACKGIRAHDEKGTIALVGEEPYPPYARPPLTKALWKDGDESKIWRGTEELDVDLRLGRRIVSLDLEARQATRRRRRRVSSTSGCCSQRAARRADCLSEATRSSISGLSTTTGGSGARAATACASSSSAAASSAPRSQRHLQ